MANFAVIFPLIESNPCTRCLRNKAGMTAKEKKLISFQPNRLRESNNPSLISSIRASICCKESHLEQKQAALSAKK